MLPRCLSQNSNHFSLSLAVFDSSTDAFAKPPVQELQPYA